MRRRFGRRRSGGAEEGRTALDVPRWIERIEAAEATPLRGLAALEPEGLPAGMAVVASGQDEAGSAGILAFAPRHAGDALLAGLVAATRPGEELAAGATLYVLAPQWSLLARRRLSLVGDTPFALAPAEAPELGDGGDTVQAEPLEEPWLVSREQLAARLPRAEDRALALRAIGGLAGLAAKHGGTLRVHGRAVELVLFARRAAAVRVDDDGVVLDTILPQRRSERLSAEGLGDALDRLEGGLRKRLNDRDVRDGEDGLRARALPLLEQELGLHAVQPWPRGGSDVDAVDLVGVDAEGRPVLAAVRQRFGLGALGPVLDAWIGLRPGLPVLLGEAPPPLRLDAPRLVLAGGEIDAVVRQVAGCLELETTFLELGRAAGELRALGTVGARPVSRREEREGRQEEREGRQEEREDRRETRDERREERGEAREGRRRRRGRGRGRDRDREREPERPAAEAPEDGGVAAWEAPEREVEESEPRPAGFEEVSLFDLDEEPAGGARDAGRRRRRRRGRRGGGEARPGEGDGEERGREGGGTRPRERREPRARLRAEVADEADEETELADGLAPLAPDAPEFVEEPELGYDEDEEAEEEGDPEGDRMRRERELRRRARVAKAAPEVAAVEPAREKPQRPRRMAILAHADRDSVAAAVVLARDVRLLDGIWVYPQSELMTFFRSVATDLREDARIHVIGFSASPFRDVLQAASLYRDRLAWFDHHAWPPEDLERMKEAIGADAVTVTPGAHSALPAVLGACSRRSRFSDKLVDLVCARFTQHDYERWGRLWWTRLARIAERPGERRADLEPLLQGRPSDLAREAAAAQTPPLPDEVEYVAGRDFRLVHFGGHVLVAVPVPPALDLHLAARIARERYGAELSLAWIEGEDLVVLAAEEAPGRRPFDVLGMVEHLAGKHDWVEALPDADHVARIAVRRLALHPERLDEVLSEIAMGRSILEG